MRAVLTFALCMAAFVGLVVGTLAYFDDRWDTDAQHRCERLGATAVEIRNAGGHYFCITPDGRVVKTW